MAAVDRKHGKKGQILMDPTGGAAPVALVSLDKWDLDMATDTVAVTSFEDTNKTYVQGLPDLKGTFGGNYDSSPEGLVIFDIIAGDVAPLIRLLPDRTEATTKFEGHGFVSGKISVDANGKVAVSGGYVAADSWILPSAA